MVIVSHFRLSAPNTQGTSLLYILYRQSQEPFFNFIMQEIVEIIGMIIFVLSNISSLRHYSKVSHLGLLVIKLILELVYSYLRDISTRPA